MAVLGKSARVREALLLSPMWAAIPFALHQSVRAMTRPDSIYIPIVFEAFFFAIGYVLLALPNAFCFVPIASAVSKRTTDRRTGASLALGVAAFAVGLLCAFDVIGKRQLRDGSALFSAFLPLAVAMYASFVSVAESGLRSKADR